MSDITGQLHGWCFAALRPAVAECLVEDRWAVDDLVEADDLLGAHHGCGERGQAQQAAGLAKGGVGGDEDVDAAGGGKTEQT
ncbi:hypothetical protein [Streptomyces sp. 1222.5]|uniref:hypothetical protein n=1 Tax=Streptomyces sp. 1222.5 TaxID=1881026 RepID=UPI003D723C56